ATRARGRPRRTARAPRPATRPPRRAAPRRAAPRPRSRRRSSRRRGRSPARRLHRQEDRVVAAPDEEQDALSLPDRLEGLPVGIDVLHRLAVHLENDVAAAEPRVGGRTARIDLCDDDALDGAIEPEILRELGRERLHRETEILGGSGPGLGRLLLLQLLYLDVERLR